jgi:hypothetical protein
VAPGSSKAHQLAVDPPATPRTRINDSKWQAIWQAGFQPVCKPVSSHNESP